MFDTSKAKELRGLDISRRNEKRNPIGKTDSEKLFFDILLLECCLFLIFTNRQSVED